MLFSRQSHSFWNKKQKKKKKEKLKFFCHATIHDSIILSHDITPYDIVGVAHCRRNKLSTLEFGMERLRARLYTRIDVSRKERTAREPNMLHVMPWWCAIEIWSMCYMGFSEWNFAKSVRWHLYKWLSCREFGTIQPKRTWNIKRIKWMSLYEFTVHVYCSCSFVDVCMLQCKCIVDDDGGGRCTSCKITEK